MKLSLSKEEAAHLIALGIESESSPLIIKGEVLNMKVSMTQKGVSLTFDVEGMESAGDEEEDE